MNKSLCVAAAVLSLAGPALAQNPAKQPKAGAKPAAKTPAKSDPAPAPSDQPLPPLTAVELAPEVFRVSSVGLSMHLPAGVQTQTTGYGDQSTQVMGKDQAWLINIKTAVTKKTLSAEEIAVEVRDQLLAMASPIEQSKGQQPRNGKTRARLLQDIKPLVIKTEHQEEARPACSFYLTMPRGEKEAPVIRGYTVFQVSEGRYVTFDLAVPEPAFAAARSAFETCIGTVRFADAKAMSAARGAAVETGITFLNGLSAADMDAACATMKDQWFRLSKPGANGEEEEIAYRHVRASKGKRGELDTARDPKHWGVEDQQEGYLVRIDARMLQEGKVIDSVGTYFMTPDRREEAWLLQMVVRDPSARKPATWRELGARSGNSMSVSTDGSGESKVAQPTIPDKGYLNQVEAFLLPQLLIHAKSPPGDFGFYAYQSSNSNGAVSLRRDVLAPSADKNGGWTITTRLNEDSEPQSSVFSDNGTLLKTTLATGNTWTPTTLSQLAAIWTAKNLPMK